MVQAFCHLVMDRFLHYYYTRLFDRASNFYFDYIGYYPFRFVNVKQGITFFFFLHSFFFILYIFQMTVNL